MSLQHGHLELQTHEGYASCMRGLLPVLLRGRDEVAASGVASVRVNSSDDARVQASKAQDTPQVYARDVHSSCDTPDFPWAGNASSPPTKKLETRPKLKHSCSMLME